MLLGRVPKSDGKATTPDKGAAPNLREAKEPSLSASCNAARTVDTIYRLAEMSRRQATDVSAAKQLERCSVQDLEQNDVTGLAKRVSPLQVEALLGRLTSSGPASATLKSTNALDRLQGQGDAVLKNMQDSQAQNQAEGIPRAFHRNTPKAAVKWVMDNSMSARCL